MLKHKDIQQHIAKEFRYAVTKMQETNNPNQKLFYFSAIFGEAQRSLNWEWNTDIALIHLVTTHVYNQINTQISSGAVQLIPVNWAPIIDTLTQVASDLAAYFEESKNNKEELYQILSSFAEVNYAATGNGGYLLEKGAFKLPST